jgi:hypothetical protein
MGKGNNLEATHISHQELHEARPLLIHNELRVKLLIRNIYTSPHN